MKTALNRITTPDLTRSDFGRAMAEQFANIDVNFQKIANMDLSKGDSGKSCAYIVYNLNSIFVYPTSDMGNNAMEYNNWLKFKQLVTDKEYVDQAVVDYFSKLQTEVDTDYQIYYAHTGGSQQDYARMCAYLLWGSTLAHPAPNTIPTDTSLTGALWASKKSSLQTPLEVTDAAGHTHSYRSVWMRDWFICGGVENWPGTGSIPENLMNKVQIYRDHILLFDPGKITVACSPAVEPKLHAAGEFEPVGSLAYVHIDPRFRNENTGDLMRVLSGDAQGQSVYEDISCVCYWEPRDYHSDHATQMWEGGFKIVNLFPQIYFDGSGFFWKINGNNTRIPVTGTQGEPGKNSQFVIVERVENIIGATPRCPQGDYEAMRDMGFAPDNGPKLVGAWLPDERQVQSGNVQAESGRSDYHKTLTGSRAADFYGAYANIPFATTTLVANNNPASNPSTPANIADQAAVLKYEIESDCGWLAGDRQARDNVEFERSFRILRIVGREFFWEATRAQRDGIEPFRPYDPSYAAYNYGDPDAVRVSTQQEIQQLISQLDGCPCIVMPGPAYRPDRTDSTIWFSTLRAVRISQEDTRLMLIAYCGVENQMSTNLDDHTLAGEMQELDSYTFKVTGDFRNKPRGLMLPIGSAYVQSDHKDDIWASHIIHADLGGFTKRHTVTAEEDAHGGYRYGDQQPIQIANARYTVGTNIPGNNLAAGAINTMQFTEVVRKRFIHIGSVFDYRTLNYVDNLETLQQDGASKNFNAAVPGRKRSVANEWHDLTNWAGDVVDYYGHSGYWGYDETPPEWAGGSHWFMGSELHVDEPVTLTRYRDLQKRKHLLNVEGDVTIGLHRHVNDPTMVHRKDDGGLLIQSTLSQEIIERYKYKANEKSESIFDEPFYTGLTLDFAPFSTIGNEDAAYNIPWRNTLWRSEVRNDPFQGRYNSNMRGLWAVNSGEVSDDLYPSEGTVRAKQYTAHPSLLAEDMLASRMMIGLDGIAIYDQNDAYPGYSDLTSTPWTKTKFSVDYAGNIQTQGREIRSNSFDTFWGFHTDWKTASRTYNMTSLDNKAYSATARNPKHNQMMFGSSHGFLNNDDITSFYWREINEQSHFDAQGRRWTIDAGEKVDLGAGKTGWRFLVPARTTDIPAGWCTELGYATTTGNQLKWQTTFDVNHNTSNNMTQGDLMPNILRLWTDLLYQTGSATVAGISMLPVRTAMDDVNYYTRFGIQSRYGLIIGGSGKQVVSTGGSGLEGVDISIPYSSNPDYEKCMLDDVLYGSTGAGVGQGDKSMDRTEPTVKIDMFTEANAKCNPGLWVQAGAVIDQTLIVGNDLAVNRASTVRGQSRAMSFRRHINSLNVPQTALGESKGTEMAILLDRGWSTCPAPVVSTSPATYKIKRSPIVMDLGPAYGPYRLLRFGQFGSIESTAEGELENVNAVPRDYESCFFGTMPNFAKTNDNVPIKTGTLFASSTVAGSQGLNPITVTGMTSGMVATVIIQIQLNFLCYSNGYKRVLRRNRKTHGAYGIAMPWQRNGDKVYSTQNATQICSGFSWNMLGEGFPRPKVPVDRWVGRAFRGNDDYTWMHGGRKNDAAMEQSGLLLRLDSDGLSIPFCAGTGGITEKQGESIYFEFTYPCMVDGITIYNQYVASTGVQGQGASQQPSGALTAYTDKQPTPTETYKYVWQRTYMGESKPSDTSTAWGQWMLIASYTNTTTEYILSMDVQKDEDYGDTPTGGTKDITSQMESLFNDPDLGESNYDKFLSEDTSFLNSVMGSYNHLWIHTINDFGNTTTEDWDLYYSKSGAGGDGGTGQVKDIKVLLSGIVTNTNNSLNFSKCYGPAAGEVSGTIEGGRATIALNNKFVITSVQANMGLSSGIKETSTAEKGRSAGGHWFGCLPTTGAPNKCYIWEMRQGDQNNDTWHTNDWNSIQSVVITICGYEGTA